MIVDILERRTCQPGAATILENVMMVGLLSGAASMGNLLASTLGKAIDDIYNDHDVNRVQNPDNRQQITKPSNSNNPFSMQVQSRNSCTDLSKYSNSPEPSKWYG